MKLQKLDLITAERKIRGLCFIGKSVYLNFATKLQPKEGIIIRNSAEAAIYNQEKPQFNSEEEAFALNQDELII